MVEEVDAQYIADGTWRNSIEQRRQMIEYPAEISGSQSVGHELGLEDARAKVIEAPFGALIAIDPFEPSLLRAKAVPLRSCRSAIGRQSKYGDAIASGSVFHFQSLCPLMKFCRRLRPGPAGRSR